MKRKLKDYGDENKHEIYRKIKANYYFFVNYYYEAEDNCGWRVAYPGGRVG